MAGKDTNSLEPTQKTSPHSNDGWVTLGNEHKQSTGNRESVDSRRDDSIDSSTDSAPEPIDGVARRTLLKGAAGAALLGLGIAPGSAQAAGDGLGDDSASARSLDDVSSNDVATGMTVYTQSYDSNLYALDPETGNAIWTFTESTERLRGLMTVVDGTLYVGSGDSSGALWAVDAATGEREWIFDDPETEVNLDPVIVGGYVYTGEMAEGTVYALDSETGDVEWTYDEFETVLRSPTVLDGVIYVVGFEPDGTGLHAIDPETGDVEWTYSELGTTTFGTPHATRERIYFGAGQSLVALDTDGELDWSREILDGIPGSPVAAPSPAAALDGMVFGKTFDEIFAVDAATGEVEWTYDDVGDRIVSFPTVVDGLVFCGIGDVRTGDYDPRLVALDARDGSLEWEFTGVTDSIDTPPAVYDGVVYTGSVMAEANTGSFWALDAQTGSVLWEFSGANDSLFSGTLVADPASGDSIDSRIRQGVTGHHHTFAEPHVDEFVTVDSRVETDGVREAIDLWRTTDTDSSFLSEVFAYWHAESSVYGPV